jgi:hypothetical protein
MGKNCQIQFGSRLGPGRFLSIEEDTGKGEERAHPTILGNLRMAH